tara:strand:+ start:110 stop:325 length:216 start_codon:yes stop_codon:yes gene_type:complete
MEKTVDEAWKKEAAESVEETNETDRKYVRCDEVEQYLTELSSVMTQIAFGINESIKTMKERVVKGDTNNDD